MEPHSPHNFMVPLFKEHLYIEITKRMKLKWIGIKFKYPLLLHHISIGEVDEEK